MLMTHGQAPHPSQLPPEWKDAVLHASMTLGGTSLMGADVPEASNTVLVEAVTERGGRARPAGRSAANGRPTALELFLDGLSAAEPELPRHAGYAALNRRLSRWLDDGLGRRSAAPWQLGLHLDERGTALALELWLHAEDDPTLACPPRFCTRRATRSSASSARATRAATSPGS